MAVGSSPLPLGSSPLLVGASALVVPLPVGSSPLPIGASALVVRSEERTGRCSCRGAWLRIGAGRRSWRGVSWFRIGTGRRRRRARVAWSCGACGGAGVALVLHHHIK